MLEKTWVDERREHERGLAEAVFSDPASVLSASTIVSEDDFHDGFYAAVFAIGVILIGASKFSHQTMRHHLRKQGYLKNEGELAEFIALKNSITTEGFWHANQLSRIVCLEGIQKLLASELKAAQQLRSDPELIRSHVESALAGLATRQSALWQTAGSVAHTVYQRHKEHKENDGGMLGISTGIKELDVFTGGYFPQQLWQIAARSYYGKTAVALNLVLSLVQRKHGVYFASYEMSNEELMERVLSSLRSIKVLEFTAGKLTQESLDSALLGVADLDGLPLLMDEHPPHPVAGLAARVKLAMQETDIKFLVVDHIHQVDMPRGSKRSEFLPQLARDYKQLAKDLGITVIILNQLNAESQRAENGKVPGDPTNLHFSEGKGVLAFLDVSLLLHRKNESSEKLKVIISKNKKGSKAEFFQHFIGEYQQLAPWPESESGGW